MTTTHYWIEYADGDYFVTDGIWTSIGYADKEDAVKHLNKALWGEK